MSDQQQQAAHMAELSEARLSQATDLLNQADAKFKAAAAEREMAALYWEDSLANWNRAAASQKRAEKLSRRSLCIVVICLIGCLVITIPYFIDRLG